MKVHFIGIGGIGVSALAQYYLAKGHRVSGSDLNSSEITDFLKKKGIKIFIGPHKTSNLPKNVDLVIYSPAVQSNNPELKEARKKRTKSQSYPQALGELTKKYYTIAIAGTHGKSTVTAMIGLILIKAGLDPTVILGTKLKEFRNSNFRMGKSKFLVIEADEWQASFLNYWPKIIVLTNIEREHLDYYKDLKHIIKTYREFIKHLPENGILVMNEGDKNISNLKSQISNLNLKTQIYTLKQKETKKLRKILKVPGEHNVLNALAALAVARVLKIPDKISFKALAEYRGAWRRFEEKDLKIENCKLKIISDYAHHPTEIEATLKAVRQKYPKKQIWCIFQPHQYQRTFYLFDDFVHVFKKALSETGSLSTGKGKLVNRLIITDIFDVAGRELKGIKKKVSSRKLIEAINAPWAIYLPERDIISYLKKNLKGKELVIVMGAGDIYKLTEQLTTENYPQQRG